jgi:hypothetical protein
VWSSCMHALGVAVTGDVLQSVLDTAKEDVETVRAQLQVPLPCSTLNLGTKS